MKTYVLIYEGFVQFEVILASYFMKTVGEIVTIGIDGSMVTSCEGYQTVPHTTFKEVQIDNIDLFIIPGGEPDKLMDNTELNDLLNRLNDKNIVISAICSAPIHLAKAGILKGRKYTTTLPVDEFADFHGGIYIDSNVVTDGNIVTAKACGYVDFAIELGKVMNIYSGEEDLQETISFFKEFKNA